MYSDLSTPWGGRKSMGAIPTFNDPPFENPDKAWLIWPSAFLPSMGRVELPVIACLSVCILTCLRPWVTALFKMQAELFEGTINF